MEELFDWTDRIDEEWASELGAMVLEARGQEVTPAAIDAIMHELYHRKTAKRDAVRAERIRQARAEHGISAEAMADALNVTAEEYGRMEVASGSMGSAAALRLCEVLGIPLRGFLSSYDPCYDGLYHEAAMDERWEDAA